MRGHNWMKVCLITAISCSGCHVHHMPDTGYGDRVDSLFGRRHTQHLPFMVRCDSMYALAKEVTSIEDEIRRDGSITVKKPDCWGDGSLTHFIQEYEHILGDSVKDFDETLQAYIARSDQLDLQSATAMGIASASTPNVLPPGLTRTSNDATFQLADAQTVDIENLTPSQLIKLALEAAPAKVKGIGVEPTTLERQRSTFVNVNQALRRRNMGGDNARAAGYALYKFRVPVSVLPGRETSRGHMAVTTLRAKLHIDEANLRVRVPENGHRRPSR